MREEDKKTIYQVAGATLAGTLAAFITANVIIAIFAR